MRSYPANMNRNINITLVKLGYLSNTLYVYFWCYLAVTCCCTIPVKEDLLEKQPAAVAYPGRDAPPLSIHWLVGKH